MRNDHVDGPSQTLLTYIEKYDRKVPATWKNYIELTSK